MKGGDALRILDASAHEFLPRTFIYLSSELSSNANTTLRSPDACCSRNFDVEAFAASAPDSSSLCS